MCCAPPACGGGVGVTSQCARLSVTSSVRGAVARRHTLCLISRNVNFAKKYLFNTWGKLKSVNTAKMLFKNTDF